MDINNKDYLAQKDKRDRAVNYWKDRIISDFLPPIDLKKRDEINGRISKMREQLEIPKAMMQDPELTKK
jgi:hypothetical protein